MSRTTSTFLISFLIHLTLSTSFALGCDIHWALCPPGAKCAFSLQTPAHQVDAGHFGTYIFSNTGLWFSGAVIAMGSERPKLYPHSNSEEPSLPCCLGPACTGDPPSCFFPLEKLHDSQDDWIAIIDWDNWHGAAVGLTAQTATDPSIKTVLFSLQNTLPVGCPGVSDLDVLINLAKIASEVDFERVPAPVAINMSFGRRYDKNDARKTPCKEKNLSCQISQLLSHLIQPTEDSPPRTAAIAAAGNNRLTLFPAVLEHVVEVGSMDLETYRDTSTVTASWEMPNLKLPAALMPGAGLCLNNWPVPAGSSFAAALYTGWLSEAVLLDPMILDNLTSASPSLWQPWRACTDDHCDFLLSEGGTQFSTPLGQAGRLVAEALYNDPSQCGKVVATNSIDTVMERVKPGSLNYTSLVDLVADQHRQCPDGSLCAPCSMDCEMPFRSKVSRNHLIPILLKIDLHAGWKLDSETDLLALFIRIDSEFHKVQLKTEDLIRIADGKIGYLNIQGKVLSTDMTAQPSLVSILSYDDGNPKTDDTFWNATPITLQ